MTDPVVIGVGTVAYDTIGTPHHKKKTVLGGSATYFAISASYFNTVGIVSVVGTDFSDESLSQLKKRKIDLNGLMSLSGKTFHWEGEYDSNLIDRKTLRTDLNVYADFNPILPEEYKDARFALLGNGTPENQMAVFTQLNSPELVLLDTMNYWINHHRSALEEVISTVKALTIDKSEALLLSGKLTAKDAVKTIFKRYGLKILILKLAEYGAVLFTKDFEFLSPAYMNERVVDPTGCGDSFAGGFLGYLSKNGISDKSLKHALIYACSMGSFTCEEFGPTRLLNLSYDEIESRSKEIIRTINL